MKKPLTLDEIIYWTVLAFAAVTVGYLLVTLIATASKEDTAFEGSTYMRKQAKYLTMETTEGTIKVLLNRAVAPVTVNNFVSLVDAGFYDQTKFHRVVKGLLVQGGDPLTRGDDRALYGTGGPGYVFEDEIRSTLAMERGALVMANLGRPKTNGSQFFFVVAQKAPQLEGKYTIFGKVIEGIEVVDAIAAKKVDERGIPVEDVVLKTISFD